METPVNMGDAGLHLDQKYIVALLKNDSLLLNEIYQKFVPKVVNYIKKNSGDEARAHDVVQDVLMTIYDQAKTKDLKLTCPFDSYFFLLCKRKWLNELKKTSNKGVTINEEIVSVSEDEQAQADATFVFSEKQQLFDAMFERLGDKCKELLKHSFTLKSMEEVAKKLEVSYAYARKKKSLCIGKLTQLVQTSEAYQLLKTL